MYQNASKTITPNVAYINDGYNSRIDSRIAPEAEMSIKKVMFDRIGAAAETWQIN